MSLNPIIWLIKKKPLKDLLKKDLFIFVTAGLTASSPACLPPTLCRINFYDVLLTSAAKFVSEEVILNEDRTTEEERRYIMEARKRALQKRKKLRTLGKSRSTDSEDEEMEEEEGRVINSTNWRLNQNARNRIQL